MEFVRGLHNLKPEHRGCVATMGNFDGVHLGHQQVLAQVRKQADGLGLPAVVVLFEPQPLEFVVGNAAPPRLTQLRDKLRLLAAYKMDQVVCLQFNHKLLHMQPQDLIHDLLLQGLSVQYFIVGDDFRFGYQRSGDFRLLQWSGQKYGFQVTSTRTHLVNGVRASSTRIREALEQHDFSLVRQMLGRSFVISGKVVKGQQLGRKMAAPTANICLPQARLALQGVFATRIHGLAEGVKEGIANIGYRPTVNGRQPQLEVHIFTLRDDLYGRYIGVEFCQFIRAEQRFNSLTELQQQIRQDIAVAENYFVRCSNAPNINCNIEKASE